jgi:quercetin dioxygenase-like cupin family protein
MRAVYEPGWKWSEDVKPIAKTDSCQAAHVGYMLSGRMAIVHADGTKIETAPGDFVQIAPGHDAWTVGSEPCVFVDFGSSVGQFAKPS